MKHRVKTHQFNRDTKARKALLKNLLRSLFEQASIITTEAKAKEIKRLADKIINQAKKADLNSRRVIHRFFGQRDVVNTVIDRIAPLMKDKVSGFTTLKKLGKRRGDNSLMVKLELVKKPKQTGTLKSGKKYDK